jgi:hypothetical protein
MKLSTTCFLECVVAKACWDYVRLFTNTLIDNYGDMANKWILWKKRDLLNSISAGVCWGLWLTRNNMIFRRQVWRDVKMVLLMIWKCTASWKPFKEELLEKVIKWCNFLGEALRTPLAIKVS